MISQLFYSKFIIRIFSANCAGESGFEGAVILAESPYDEERKLKDSKMLACHECGKENQESASFCNWCGRALNESSATGLLPSRTFLQAGRYYLLERVGQGGMGAVYKALDTTMQQKVVAVKEMSQRGLTGSDLRDAITAFSSESAMLARLDHRSLPHIYQQFEEAGRRYLVMDFIEGETLEYRFEEYQQRGERLPLEQVLNIGLQLCAVLDYLHSQQPPVIFRDLKPANIMLNAQGQVYLIDFGIARLFKPEQTKDTMILGSPGYAAPEQYQGTSSPRSDLYSLGATLHQLLTGDDPSQSPLHCQPFTCKIPELATLVMSLVALDRLARPLNARVVQKTLQKIARDLQHGSATIPAQPVPRHRSTSSVINPVKKPTTLYVAISPAARDQQVWKSIQQQLVTLLQSFPRIHIWQLDFSHQSSKSEILDAVEQADLVLCLLSEDFLASSLCMMVANKAIDYAKIKSETVGAGGAGRKVLCAILSACAWQETRLASIPLISSDVIMHSSLYAQQLQILAIARRICAALALLLLPEKKTGTMSLSQWLLWQFYGNGAQHCPLFTVNQYTLLYARSLGRGGLLFNLFDQHAGYVVGEYIIESLASTSIAHILQIIAPAAHTPDAVQGIAQRERPAHVTL